MWKTALSEPLSSSPKKPGNNAERTRSTDSRIRAREGRGSSGRLRPRELTLPSRAPSSSATFRMTFSGFSRVFMLALRL
jgi:hypothetical protein